MKSREEQDHCCHGRSADDPVPPESFPGIHLGHSAIKVTERTYIRDAARLPQKGPAEGSDAAAAKGCRHQMSERVVVEENPLPAQLEQEN